MVRSSGVCSKQMALARLQRPQKRQPGLGLTGLPTSPSMGMRVWLAS